MLSFISPFSGYWFVDVPAIIAGAVISYGIIWRMAIHPFFKGLREFIKSMRNISQTWNEVYAEFRPNGGHSMKDQLNRMDSGAKVLTENLKIAQEHITKVAEDLLITNQKRDEEGQLLRDHIDNENHIIDSLNETVQTLANQLKDREPMFEQLQTTLEHTNDVLEEHMHEDKILFASAQTALVEGQKQLLERIFEIKNGDK